MSSLLPTWVVAELKNLSDLLPVSQPSLITRCLDHTSAITPLISDVAAAVFSMLEVATIPLTHTLCLYELQAACIILAIAARYNLLDSKNVEVLIAAVRKRQPDTSLLIAEDRVLRLFQFTQTVSDERFAFAVYTSVCIIITEDSFRDAVFKLSIDFPDLVDDFIFETSDRQRIRAITV